LRGPVSEAALPGIKEPKELNTFRRPSGSKEEKGSNGSPGLTGC